MDTERYCAFNTTRDCFLSSEVTLIDAALDPLTALKVLVEGLAEGSEAGLWLTPLSSIPMVPRISPFDILYLDKNHQVTQAAELLPGAEFPPFEIPSGSALLLPLHTISSTQTGRGDSVRICVDREIAISSELAEATSERSSWWRTSSIRDHHFPISLGDEQERGVSSFPEFGQVITRADSEDPLREAGEVEPQSVMGLFRPGGFAEDFGKSAGSTMPNGHIGAATAIEALIESAPKPVVSGQMTTRVWEADWQSGDGLVESSRNGHFEGRNGTQECPFSESLDSGTRSSEFTVAQSQSLTWRTSPPTGVPQAAHSATLPEVLTQGQPASVSSNGRASEPSLTKCNGSPIAYYLAPGAAALQNGEDLPDVMDGPELAWRFEASTAAVEAPEDFSSAQNAESTAESGLGVISIGQSPDPQAQSRQMESEERVPGPAPVSRENRVFGWLKHSRAAMAPLARIARGLARAATRQSLTAQLKRWFEPEMPLTDRRRSNRRQIPSLVAHYWTRGASKSHRVIDINEGGFYVVTEDRWVPETMIQMTLQKRGNGRQRKVSISILAKVVRSGRRGVGAEFVLSETLDSHSREMLGARGTDRRTLARFLR